MKGQGMLTAGATSGITRMLDMGAEVGYGQYLLRGYWYTAASVASHKIRTSGAYLMRYIDLLPWTDNLKENRLYSENRE